MTLGINDVKSEHTHFPTHSFNVQSILRAIERITHHREGSFPYCSMSNRTARSSTTGEVSF